MPPSANTRKKETRFSLIERAFDDCKAFLLTHTTSPNHDVQKMITQRYDILQTAVNELSFVDVQIEIMDGW
jgi:hypothetical protein